jgi:hypothetical protein
MADSSMHQRVGAAPGPAACRRPLRREMVPQPHPPQQATEVSNRAPPAQAGGRAIGGRGPARRPLQLPGESRWSASLIANLSNPSKMHGGNVVSYCTD